MTEPHPRVNPSFRWREISGRLAIVSLLVLISGLAAAKEPVVGEDVDIYGRPLEYIEQPEDKWEEVKATIPSYPRDEDLLRVKLPDNFTIELYVDGSTIDVAKDGVARMTVVVKSKGGVPNVFYEGFRCSTVAHKTYAFGTVDRTFKEMKKVEWQTLPFPEANNYLRRLFHDYICADDISSRPAREIRSLIEKYEFTTDYWLYN